MLCSPTSIPASFAPSLRKNPIVSLACSCRRLRHDSQPTTPQEEPCLSLTLTLPLGHSPALVHNFEVRRWLIKLAESMPPKNHRVPSAKVHRIIVFSSTHLEPPGRRAYLPPPPHKGCWNVAVRCCGSGCDLPWGDSTGSSASNDRAGQQSQPDPKSEGRRTELLELAPAFYKVGAVVSRPAANQSSETCERTDSQFSDYGLGFTGARGEGRAVHVSSTRIWFSSHRGGR